MSARLRALGLQVGVELVDQRRHRQPGAVAPRFLEGDAEVLAHPVDGEAEVELALDHGRAAVVHLPALRRALADDLEHRLHVEAGALAEGDRLRQALHQAGDGDLVDHLGELTRAARPEQSHRLGEGHRHRAGGVERCRVAAAHHGERAVDRAQVAARDRRVDEADAAPAAASASSRATAAEAVVWSTKIAPRFMPAKAPSAPMVIERRSSSLPTQAKTISAPSAAAAGVARALAAVFLDPLPGLGGGAVVDGHGVAGARQVAGHRIAHHAQAEEGDAARRDRGRRLWCSWKRKRPPRGRS